MSEVKVTIEAPENPNEYDDDAFTQASTVLVPTVSAMWSAGASVEDIAADIQNGLADADA